VSSRIFIDSDFVCKGEDALDIQGASVKAKIVVKVTHPPNTLKEILPVLYQCTRVN
jgi:hypothetical protein